LNHDIQSSSDLFIAVDSTKDDDCDMTQLPDSSSSETDSSGTTSDDDSEDVSEDECVIETIALSSIDENEIEQKEIKFVDEADIASHQAPDNIPSRTIDSFAVIQEDVQRIPQLFRFRTVEQLRELFFGF
jgi:hypothetical protein